MKTKADERTYTVEELKVADLLVDTRVQRDGLQQMKVDNIVANFNPDAVGVIHVSRRQTPNGDLIGDYVIDGWHRKEAVVRVTEGAGTITAHVYEGLTLAQEAQMFLDLNYGNQPSPLEKHKARVHADDEQALRIEQRVHNYGWDISPVPANGHVNAIQKLYQLDNMSQKMGADPDLLTLTFLTITRAWGTERHASQAVILEGIGRLHSEYTSKIDVDHLIDRLKNYKGGPRRLHEEARQFANTTGQKVSMAVAWLVVEAYNKGKKDDAKSALPTWRKRS
jgi:hypothetical protein